MKKILLAMSFLLSSFALFAQNDHAHKEHKQDNKSQAHRNYDKNEMGQSIKEVNAWYKDRRKAINKDASLSKEQKKELLAELTERKNDRIHELNSGKATGDDKAKNKKLKEPKPEKEKQPKAKGKKA